MEIKALFEELRCYLTVKRLQELTLTILRAKRDNDHRQLKRLFLSVFDEDVPKDMPENRVFFKLINFFHPDRLAFLSREIQTAADTRNKEKLIFFRKALTVRVSGGNARKQPNRPAWEYTETYGYDEPMSGDYDFGDFEDGTFNDSGFDDTFRGEDEEFDDEYPDQREEDMDFIRAVKAEYLGNLDIDFTPAELTALSGELDLTNYGIEDLEGLEYCRGITHLNLSNNRISNLFDLENLYHLRELYLGGNQIADLGPLSGLTNLEILDLSSNDIEDLTPLLSLAELKFVNLLGNPIRDRRVIETLNLRGVVVLSD